MATSSTVVGGVVLCGGSSRRMGSCKAWLPLGGEYLLQRMVRIVSGVVHPVVIAARPGQVLPPLPNDVLYAFDAVENGGPLAGMASAFDTLDPQCEAAWVTSCDHPMLRAAFVEYLVEMLGASSAVVPNDEGHLYPLSAVYRLDTRTLLDDRLARGELRVSDFVTACGARLVAANELRSVDPDLESLRNINSPETYNDLLRELHNTGECHSRMPPTGNLTGQGPQSP